MPLISVVIARAVLLEVGMKNYRVKAKTFCLVLLQRSGTFSHWSQCSMPKRVKPFSEADKRAAIELWKSGISLKRIREQLGMSERGLKTLSYAKKHPEDPIAR
jgi:hypothetical protein